MNGPVLVTGGGGYVGSHLVDALLDEGTPVTVLDDFSTGSRGNLAHRAASDLLRIETGDVRDAAVVDRLAAGHVLIFHLAAAVGVRHIVGNPLDSILINVVGTENVLRAAHRNGARVLIASTSEVYGRGRVPFREDDDRVLGPTWMHRWSYSTAKALDEHLAFAYKERGLAMSIVRYFNSYGPRLHESGYGSVVARFIRQASAGEPLTVHGTGKQTRSFTYVDDTVRGTLAAAERDGALGKVFNIGNPTEITIDELATRIRDRIAPDVPIVHVPYESYYPAGFEDTPRRVPDVTLARDVLEFEATVPLDDGLGRTIEWWKARQGSG